jgi:predicted RNase H-like HicB family nuclease
VTVPDLPGCFSAGDTIEEAFDNAREAIEAHCGVLAEDGKTVPTPKPMSTWQNDSEYRGWTWGIVDVPVDRFFGPAEKINITVPGRLLKQIDELRSLTDKPAAPFSPEPHSKPCGGRTAKRIARRLATGHR